MDTIVISFHFFVLYKFVGIDFFLNLLTADKVIILTANFTSLYWSTSNYGDRSCDATVMSLTYMVHSKHIYPDIL